MPNEQWFLEYRLCGNTAENRRIELTSVKDPESAVNEARKEWAQAKRDAFVGHIQIKNPKVVLSIDLE
jgi:hypothetical protein